MNDSEKLDSILQKLNEHDKRFDALESKVDRTNKVLDALISDYDVQITKVKQKVI